MSPIIVPDGPLRMVICISYGARRAGHVVAHSTYAAPPRRLLAEKYSARTTLPSRSHHSAVRAIRYPPAPL
ncbi:jg25783 [Pararge aegeria aegeria]|uniref:Jg25783 protein n=1 Tax=Pararge aegeria aegeria TaxID=348720 RepID=A0A8S4QDE9_9NEOP|nr:jg25783 [Pararge aegeria aegeria]